MTLEEVLKENREKMLKDIQEKEKRYKKEQLFIGLIGTFVVFETVLVMYLMAR